MLFVCLFVVVRGAKALRATSFVGDVVACGVSDATLELSLLLNGRSFVGREVARRVVSAAAERDGCSCAVSILLRHSCCVRFFSWMESTHVPSHLAPAHSSVRSSRLEESATMLTMMDKAPLAVVCKDLFYFRRQLLCARPSIFFSRCQRTAWSWN